MPREKLSWKWKITIAIVVLLLVLIGVVFTPVGHNIMRNGIQKTYDETPAKERATSEAADTWLALAFYVGWVCQQSEDSMTMYKQFLGVADNQEGDFWTRSNDWQEKWDGFFQGSDRDGYTGWGPLHPRAPEAFYNYMQLYGPTVSDQFEGRMARHYYDLFYTKYGRMTRTWKPHPKFYVYWDKIKIMCMKWKGDPPPDVPPRPDGYEGPPE